MTTLGGIRRLHAGQLATLCLLAGSAAAGLLFVRAKVAARKEMTSYWYELSGTTIFWVDDSLRMLKDPSEFSYVLRCLTISENRRSIGLAQIPFNECQHMQRQNDSIDEARLALRLTNLRAHRDSLHEQLQSEARDRSISLFSIGVVIGALVLAILSVLWIWFGGRRLLITSDAVEPDTAPSGQSPVRSWGVVWANPMIRFIGGLLLLLLGLVVFRIGAEVASAIRSVM